MDKALVISIGAALMLPPLAIIVGALVWQCLSPQTRKDLPLRFARSRWRPLVAGMGVLVLMSLVTYLAGGRASMLRAAIGAVPMAAMFAALSMFSQLRQRRGTTLRCAACEYDLTGVEEGSPLEPGAHDAKCPECGAFWGLPRGTVTGERVWSRRALVVAVVLLLPLLSSIVIPFTAGYAAIDKVIARVMPTGSLIQQVAYTRGFRMTEWAELRTRTLTAEQRETLAHGLLSRDALQLHAWGDEAKWLVGEFAAGRLSDATRASVLKRFLQVEMLPPGDPSRLHRQELQPAGAASQPPRPTWTVAGNGAWGLGGCFVGWSIHAVLGPVVDDSGKVIREPGPLEAPVDIAVRSQPPSKSTWTADDPLEPSLAFESTSRPRLSVWVIAEPRVRTPQAVVWNDGVPVTASDVIVVRIDLPAMK